MKIGILPKIKAFFLTLCICLVIFAAVSPFSIAPQREAELAAELPYSAAPYTSSSAVRVLITVTDLPLCFLLELSPARRSSQVICLPTASVKNSTLAMEQPVSKQGAAAFFEQTIDFSVTLDTAALKTIIDQSGGIVIDTPYGLPSPSGNGSLIAAEEVVRLYGHSVISLLCSVPTPDTARLTYYAQLLSLVCQGYLSDFGEQKYFFLKESCSTDISYVTYYDSAETIEACMVSVSYTAAAGVWINDQYYLE